VSILTSLGAPEADVPPATRFERAIGMRIRAPISTAEAAEAIWGSAVETKARVLALEASRHESCGPIRQACTQARKHAAACDDASSGAVELDDLRREPDVGPAFTMVPPPTLLERTIGMRVRIGGIIGGTASDAEAAWLANDEACLAKDEATAA
jgi:hypothetical protein